jgi:C-terminal processing protease CtpA/Prc
MRLLALLAAAAFAFASVPSAAGAAPPSREEALVALCRLWNAVRFFHPALTSEADARWDDALLAAEPAVERDPSALRETAAAMLATLHDPLTALESDPGRARSATPSAEDRDGVRIVRLNGPPADESFEAYAKALGDALKAPATARAMIVDLRTGSPLSRDQFQVTAYALAQARIAPNLIDRPTARTVLAQRYYLGFPPEVPGGGDYREGRETTGSDRLVTPAKDARALPVAFVVDATAVVPNDALVLQRAGRAALFSADGSPGRLPGSAQVVDAGSGLRFSLRISAPTDPVATALGGWDAALAWARDPKPLGSGAAAQTPAPPVPIEERYAAKTLPDEAHRVLAAFRMWGTIAYLYPYRGLMGDDWDAALRDGLRDLHGVTTPLEYSLALEKTYAHIHDTHGYTVQPAFAEAFGGRPAFFAGDVEGKPTIRDADPAAAARDGFRVGDVIEAVDGESATARWARLRQYVVASTPRSARERFDNDPNHPGLLTGPPGSVAVLRLRGADGRVREVRTPRLATAERPYVQRTRPVVDVLPGNVGYADLARLDASDAEPALVRLAGTRALVFDLRGYPHGTAWTIAPHLTARRARAALFRTPVRRVPVGVAPSEGLEYVDQTRDFYQLVVPKAPRYAKPVVVVIDPRAVSQSEHTALYLRAAANVRFVGEPTSGANGDVTRFYLPGGIMLWFTGQAVLHPDGAQLQRVGIVPDVRVAPTLRGIRAGDDELLSAGLREALRLAHADTATTRAALAQERAAERADALARTKPASVRPLGDSGAR